jgi:hypothetical protein
LADRLWVFSGFFHELELTSDQRLFTIASAELGRVADDGGIGGPVVLKAPREHV